jgi:hypothetical protein
MKKLTALVAAALGLFVLSCDILPFNEFTPTGSQFSINPDIEVVSLTGSPDLSPKGPFTLGLTVKSKSGSSETDLLPAGLLLRRRVNNTQHMLLLKPHPVTANTSNTLVLLGSFCCNKNRPSPDQGDTFDIGPVTDNSDLSRLVNLLASKDISDGSDMWMVQRAVYMVTDSTGLTQAYIDSINALPPEK